VPLDLSPWSDLYDQPAPVSYVHLDVSRGAHDAAASLSIRWRDLQETLADQGSPAEDQAALDEVVTMPVLASGAASRFAVAQHGRLRYDRVLTGSGNGPDLAGYGPAPDLTPVLRHAARQVPYVVVEAGRDGAEISVQEGGQERRHDTVEGEDVHLSKVRGGGWSHRRMQQHTEEVWRRNAAEVADAVDKVWRRAHARLLVLAGDVRAREKVRSNLPAHLVDALVEVDRNTRPEGASAEAVDAALEATIERLRAEERRAALDRLCESGNEHGVVGLEATVDGLRQSRVEVLLLDVEAARRRDLTALDGPPWVAHGGTQEHLAEPIGDLPADTALLRAAALTGAGVLFVDAEDLPGEEGVAGLVRWDAP
jgi:hypothetical protein